MPRCNECSYTTDRVFNLKRHVKSIHGKDYNNDMTTGRCLCLEEGCEFRCLRIQDLREHLTKSHSMIFGTEQVKHRCYQDFERWKAKIESEYKCSFVKQTGTKQKGKDGCEVHYLQCNRSGVQRKKVKAGERHSKAQGSCKIDMNCTCTMVVSIDEKGLVTTEVCYEHYGHHKELQHLWISDEIRTEVAAKLLKGVPYDRILDDVRDSASKIQRDHLLTKKDIQNIEKCFGINTVQKHPNDQISVSILVSEWEKLGENNPILFMKMQGDTPPDDIDMSVEDFIIVIQNPLQKSMLQKFGPNGVCIDSTHGTNAYDFSLITLLVVDEFGEGFPVAWCLSNHEDFTSLCIMFTQIKANCGEIAAAWLMSDMAQQFYNAWVAVMGGPRPQKLICTWHVDKAWREELRKKIGNVEVEAETYKRLRLLLEESEEVEFERNLVLLLEFLQISPDLETFSTYFHQYWAERKKEWAFVFRKNCGINTNMYVEAFHRAFKYNYLKGKSNKRLDNCLVSLVKFARDKGFERILKLTKGKASHRSREIHAKHVKSTSMSFDHIKEIDALSYKVTCQDNTKVYVVQQVKEDPCCQMRCIDCGICIHSFTCNCPDNLAVTGICKHIHLIKRWQMQTRGQATSNMTAPAISQQEVDFTTSLCQTSSNTADLAQKKQDIERKLLAMVGDIREVADIEVLEEVDKQLATSQSLLKGFRGMTASHIQSAELSKPLGGKHKNIERQNRFCSTKKKKGRCNIRYGRPTSTEKQTLVKEMEERCMQELQKDKNIMKWLEVLTTPTVVQNMVAHGKAINANQLVLTSIPGEMVEVPIPMKAKVAFQGNAWQNVLKAVEQLHQEWTCALCDEIAFVNMIQCDVCTHWFHWSCVEVTEEEEDDWFCNQCKLQHKC